MENMLLWLTSSRISHFVEWFLSGWEICKIVSLHFWDRQFSMICSLHLHQVRCAPANRGEGSSSIPPNSLFLIRGCSSSLCSGQSRRSSIFCLLSLKYSIHHLSPLENLLVAIFLLSASERLLLDSVPKSCFSNCQASRAVPICVCSRQLS